MSVHPSNSYLLGFPPEKVGPELLWRGLGYTGLVPVVVGRVPGIKPLVAVSGSMLGSRKGLSVNLEVLRGQWP